MVECVNVMVCLCVCVCVCVCERGVRECVSSTCDKAVGSERKSEFQTLNYYLFSSLALTCR